MMAFDTPKRDATMTRFERWIDELARQRVRAVQQLGPVAVRQISVRDEPREISFLLAEGDRWGEVDSVAEIRFAVAIPEAWRGAEVALYLQFAVPDWLVSEGLIFIDDRPFHAIDTYHHEVLLPADLAARAGFAVFMRNWLGYAPGLRTVQALELRLIDPATDQLHTLAAFIVDLAKQFAPDSRTRLQLLAALERMAQMLDLRDGAHAERFYASSQAALAQLRADYAALATPAERSPFILQPRLTAFGHAHIDVAWLWRVRHTRMKAVNTFSTQLYHMDRYPQFHFFQSTPQLYQFVKDDRPDLYARIQERVRAGQWEAEGGTWLEMDTNIPSGESLIRQFLYGKRFFREEFGVESRLLFLPDVFGYSAALPQIIRGAGAEYFITQKISWNETNRFPYDTFWWEGLDGSRVLAQYITNPGGSWYTGHIYNYNANTTARDVFGTWSEYQQKALNHELLLSYGYGDGGGGPTRAMIERLAYLDRSVSPDMPTAIPGKVIDYMDRLKARISAQPATPIWRGELYFEYHRGTYTSQAAIKRANRAAEHALHTTEWLAVAGHVLAGIDYPVATFEAAWKLVLLNQFHDIIPGSSIPEVYVDALQELAQVQDMTQAMQSGILARLARGDAAESAGLRVFNPLGWARGGLVQVPSASLGMHAQFAELPVQDLGDGQTLLLIPDIPAYGYQTFIRGTAAAALNPFTIAPQAITTPYFAIALNERGQITSLVDRLAFGGQGREVIAPGARGNVFQLFEDRPLNFDAWDINDFYALKQWELDQLVDLRVVETGPLRAGLRMEWAYGARTRIVQHLYVYAHTRRIDFITEVAWHERQTLLKVAFPVDIQSNEATAEIQFGNLRRPTHFNTSWDRARFETCAHQWFDLSEGDYGVAILNDCKYGYDVHANVLRQTLLKGGIDPDPLADDGDHRFTYSLFPHSGDWFAGAVHRAAYALNLPLIAVPASLTADFPPAWSLVAIDVDHVIIETVKAAESGNGVVVRVYECANRRGSFALTFPFKVTAAVEANLIEEDPQPATIGPDGHRVIATIRPYQIKTFIVTPAP